MQLPEPYWNMSVLTGRSRDDLRGYEHSVSVLMPWRRYRQHHVPLAVEGSPSRIVVGEEGRQGTELAVIRESVLRSLPPEDLAVMLGELTEAWVSMTYETNARSPKLSRASPATARHRDNHSRMPSIHFKNHATATSYGTSVDVTGRKHVG